MRRKIPKSIVLVALWSVISAAGMLTSFLPVGLLAGLGQWWLLRSRLHLTRASAIAFALAFPIGQLPSYFLFMIAYVSGFGGFDGPPEWYVAMSLAIGGLLAGSVQSIGLPKSRKNLVIWIPATSLAWAVASIGDLDTKGLPVLSALSLTVLSALLSGLVTGLAMLTLSLRQEGESGPKPGPLRIENRELTPEKKERLRAEG